MDDDLIKMTRTDLYDWVRTHGCIIIPLPEIRGKVLKVENPNKPGHEAWLGLPIDDKLVRDYTVFNVCTKLGIEIPNHSTYMKELHERIENDHNIKKRFRG